MKDLVIVLFHIDEKHPFKGHHGEQGELALEGSMPIIFREGQGNKSLLPDGDMEIQRG